VTCSSSNSRRDNGQLCETIGRQQSTKAEIRTRDIPIVVVTGQAAPLVNLPADCVLQKPVDPQRLVAVVEQYLAGRAD
jgi:CheY-like chemotaxis protein